jgi:hypothetical protein
MTGSGGMATTIGNYLFNPGACAGEETQPQRFIDPAISRVEIRPILFNSAA